jgi:uncharacterized membrane protein YkoI
MLDTARKTATTVAALGALGLGGAAIADAGKGTSASPARASYSGYGFQIRPQRAPLSSEVAAKVKAAALDKVPGATVLRTEAGGPYGTPYHAHIRTSNGARKVVLVNSSFEATAVQADRGPGGRGRPGRRGDHGGPGRPGGPGHGETALTGDTKSKVEAAVLDKYPGATIERTETNTDGSAPYESHITTKDGKQLEVQVSKDFEVVASNEHPAHP